MSRPRNALIVDDEPHVRTFLRLILRELGIDTTWEAPDGGQALALIAAHRPELVLLDLNMPVLGGLDVLRQIEAAQPGTPVIIVSSQSATKGVLEAARLGAIGYVLKQRPKDEIVATIRDALNALETPAADESED